MVDTYLSNTSYPCMDELNKLLNTNGTHDIFYPTIQLCNCILRLMNKFKLNFVMEINDNSAMTSSVLNKVSENNGFKINIMAIENKPHNNINNYFPVLKNDMSCLDIWKQNNISLPHIIINSVLHENITKIIMTDLLISIKHNTPIIILYFSVSDKTFLDEFRNNKNIDNYHVFERYVKILPKYKCPSNLSKKIPLLYMTVFFIRKDLLQSRNRWSLESQFDDIIGIENIIDMPILYVNTNIIVKYYNNIELLDNIRTYDGNEPKIYYDIIKHLETKKEIPLFVKTEKAFNEFKYLSFNGLYPYTLKTTEELSIFYNKIKDVDKNDFNLNLYLKNNNFPNWIKTKNQILRILMFLEISGDKKIIENEKSVSDFYSKLILEHGIDIRKYN